jgi:hypothetical protein
MKFSWKVAYVSEKIEIGKEETKEKIVLCVEEIAPEKEYPDRVAIDFVGQKLDLITVPEIKEGDIVDVFFSMSYNRYPKDGKESIFNTLRGYKVDVVKRNIVDPEKKAAADDLPF